MVSRVAVALGLLSATLLAGPIPGKVVEDELPPLKKRDDPFVFATYAARSYTGKKPVPLVFAIHAGRGSARQFATFLRPLAESIGGIVLCPQGFEEVVGADGYWWKGNKAEMIALDRLFEHAKAKLMIDSKRITLVGLADGAELGLRWAFSKDRDLQGVVALNFLWKFKGRPKTKKPVKVVLFACEDAKEKLESLKAHAVKARKALVAAKLPVVLRIKPGNSRSFFHGWDSEFRKAYDWFEGKRDWPRELAPPEPKKGEK
jgi:hypothetical protein